MADATLTRAEILAVLGETDPARIETIRERAEEVLLRHCGDVVHYRGLIEFSNRCVNDCYYCGIRVSNHGVRRYDLDKDAIISGALWCAEQGYGSIVLQSGERRDEAFVAFVEDAVRTIKLRTRSERLPRGLGITLCVGEQTEEVYRRFFVAGSHRYLLRIETSNPELFARIHPPRQRLEERIECLRILRRVGFQVGTGVMIGLPGQTLENLADDVLFFGEMDIDMVGMGPYIPHHDTPLIETGVGERTPQERFRLALLLIAATRIALKDVNIAATTALQAIDPQGREEGLRFGANIIMPQLTPLEVRRDYLLYDGKPCLDESAEKCRSCLEARILSVGRRFGPDQWGDSRHQRRIGAV